MKSENNSMDIILKKEARLFARYLLDCEPPPDMVDRYIDANRKLGIDAVIAYDTKIMEFALTHSWSVPFLDAAAGFLQPDALLRKKIYVMAAVLEASPQYVKDFLPAYLSALMLFVQLIRSGLLAGIKVLIGIPLFLFVRRPRND